LIFFNWQRFHPYKLTGKRSEKKLPIFEYKTPKLFQPQKKSGTFLHYLRKHYFFFFKLGETKGGVFFQVFYNKILWQLQNIWSFLGFFYSRNSFFSSSCSCIIHHVRLILKNKITFLCAPLPSPSLQVLALIKKPLFPIVLNSV